MTNAPSFEASFARLEAILEKMNETGIELEQAITLYEEADKLITQCGSKLKSAEQKIEMLIKKRSGEMEISESGLPKTEPLELE
jgi:Exonuclease VII small subunit